MLTDTELLRRCRQQPDGILNLLFYSDRVSKKQAHEFDEYMVCVSGQYTVVLNDEEFVLNSRDELFIPKGTEHLGKCIAGTRTIHAFGRKRIRRTEE
ncbi:hypothetical protein [Methanosarcina sp.]|uniref:cupin domain-containing protein n=1 Tax=Methanosarcina sp. TaxID=2213 RepID=UPI0029883014|nr:hypothetical protein [Methanosarcina sp.]MDW5551692.1 hypothetical protein [Methanosarcina sp.]MDW5553195.1 hypothetical protein [Methanosarcina sp.]MDW5558342.1 hypothetical protein [Methanosarcina sp.]